MTLYGPNGAPISTRDFKKAAPPRTGPSYGIWAGRELEFLQLPGGGLVQFNLNNLTMQDFRTMRDHYQINASLSVLTFMVHQADWRVECEDKKIARHCEANLREIWTRLVRAVSQSYWAGYSPSSLEWDNDLNGRTLQLTKVKDLVPEECTVNWKLVPVDLPGPSQITPKVKRYDGIKQRGWPGVIPVENSFWYPLLMENGNYYGRKLLRSAFTSWFFSILVHLFANRYFERFGEPVPVGRAPYGEEVEMDGKTVRGNVLMEGVLSQLRNRSVVVLPNDRTTYGDTGSTAHYDYEVEYLESQMRGADFERYLLRLDEEMSLALFTPLLLLRTADVGSYNLGIGHMQMYLWMLNALLGDKKEYVDRYILSQMVDYNFSPTAPRARIVFRKLGKENMETIRAVLTELFRGGKLKADPFELGQIAGLTLTEIQEVTEPPADPKVDPRTGRQKNKTKGVGVGRPKATGKDITAGISAQVTRAYREGTFGAGYVPSLGHRQRMEESLRLEGYSDAEARTAELYRRVGAWLADTVALGRDEFSEPADFMGLFERVLEAEVDALVET
jgi:hypothetical protein